MIRCAQLVTEVRVSRECAIFYFFILLTRPPPGSTLFPYTTLFRSRLDGAVTIAGCDKSLPGMVMAAARLNVPTVFLYGGTIIDRKSTRLNSSHRCISYAVFCLKKKKVRGSN